MRNKDIYIVEFNNLFKILHEINSLLNYNFYEINYKNFLIKKNQKNCNSLFIFENSDFFKKNDIDLNNILIFNNFPISINKIFERINISLLKSIYQSNSQIKFRNYILNLNDKTINLKAKKLRLTEKEVNIIIFLLKKKIPQKTLILQKEIWGYNQNLETHTVETHIYRLRKKINNFFNDSTILKKNKEGYLL